MEQTLAVHPNPVDSALHNITQYLDREEDYLDAALFPVQYYLRMSPAYASLQTEIDSGGTLNEDDLRYLAALMFLAGREAARIGGAQ
jgi:hypothetical protein